MRRIRTAVVICVCVCVNACGAEPQPAPKAQLAEKQEAYSSAGVERVIPLRFVAISGNNPATYKVPLQDVEANVERANRGFRPAGVQFFTRSYETYYLPSLQSACLNKATETAVSWSTVGTDLLKVFPNASSTIGNRTPCEWLQYAAWKWGRDEDVFLWVSNAPSGCGGHFSNAPDNGRSVFMCWWGLEPPCGMATPCGRAKYTLAHELGHYFSMPHIWNVPAWINARTGVAATAKDYWDLVYGTTDANHSTFTFFDSSDDAASWTGGFAPISRCEDCGTSIPSSLTLNSTDHSVSARISPQDPVSGYFEDYAHNDPQLLGRVTFNTGNPSGTGANLSYAKGSNLMSYIDISYDNAGSISTSQANIVRATLRYDVPSADGAIVSGTSGKRHLLGQMQARQAAFKFDLDSDGLRDVGIYTPPIDSSSSGQFKVLLSSRGYSTSTGNVMSVSLGNIGETPVVIDYDGDGRDDLAVFGATSGNGLSSDSASFRICLTPSIPSTGTIPTCSTITTDSNISKRGDIPVQVEPPYASSYGKFMIYRPSTCEWWVRRANGTNSTYTHGGTCDPSAVPLAGLYDWDTKTDLVTYEPKTGTFRMLNSKDSWATASELTRTFPSSFVAATSGTSDQRSSSIPVWGMYRTFRNYNLGAQGPWANRLGLSLWDHQSGRWGILWDPINSSTLDFNCVREGGFSQLPLPSFGTNFATPGNGVDSQPAIFTPKGTNTASQTYGQLSWLTSSPYSCTGMTQTTVNAPSAVTGRSNVAVVGDMSGDGEVEVLYHVPDSGRILKVTSDSGYTTSTTYSIGDARAQLL